MNNAWQLYRLTPKGREDPKDLLSFIRHIVQTYFQKYTPQRQRASRVSVTGKERVEESVRLSNSLHVLETNLTQIRCGLCRKNTWKKCKHKADGHEGCCAVRLGLCARIYYIGILAILAACLVVGQHPEKLEEPGNKHPNLYRPLSLPMAR
ncbi:hypothetical protein J6590_018607 [Homalodisca vitripennis]|nr:hypothetical protein J6590_018607 [Homalodisca vitripennis]